MYMFKMASILWIMVMTMVMIPNLDATPIKRSAEINKREITNIGSSEGTPSFFDYYHWNESYPDLDYYWNDIACLFPDNLTEIVMSALPSIENSQRKIVSLLGQALQQNRDLMERQEEQIARLASTLSDLLTDQQTVYETKLIPTALDETDLTTSWSDLLTNQQDVRKTTSQSTASDQIDVTTYWPYWNWPYWGWPTTEPTVTPPFDQVFTKEPLSYADCQDVAARGFRESGSYEINPPDGLGSFMAYCDMETVEGPWTVLQMRFDGSVNFNRSWNDYEQGFGNTEGEHWMGLRNIKRLVSQEGTSWQLRIDLEAFDGDTAYAVYDDFSISDAETNYTLSVGTYHGNATDALNYDNDRYRHHGMKFSTYDRDNDRKSSNCASSHKGGWWYNSCLAANLNGQYLGAPDESDSGMIWFNFKWKHSIKRSEMKMRRLV